MYSIYNYVYMFIRLPILAIIFNNIVFLLTVINFFTNCQYAIVLIFILMSSQSKMQ